MQRIETRSGDACRPIIGRGRNAIIAHVVNDRGGWGRGNMFTGSISNRWPEPEHEYREWFNKQVDWEMGAVQFVRVDPRIVVANMLSQVGYKSDSNPCPLSYPALVLAWGEVVAYAQEHRADIHFPKFGAGLAGGDWDIISEIIERDTPSDVGLFCYTLV